MTRTRIDEPRSATSSSMAGSASSLSALSCYSWIADRAGSAQTKPSHGLERTMRQTAPAVHRHAGDAAQAQLHGRAYGPVRQCVSLSSLSSRLAVSLGGALLTSSWLTACRLARGEVPPLQNLLLLGSTPVQHSHLPFVSTYVIDDRPIDACCHAHIGVPPVTQSRLSMAPSQRAQPNLNRFFTLASADDVFNVLVEAMRRAVREGTSGGGLVQAVRSEQMDAPNGELEDGRQRRSGRICKIRFTARDDRRQFMLGAVLVDEEFLPPTAPDGSFMMDLDGADGEEGDKGLVVVFSRKQGDPLAFKKLYREVLLSLPHGFVHCT